MPSGPTAPLHAGPHHARPWPTAHRKAGTPSPQVPGLPGRLRRRRDLLADRERRFRAGWWDGSGRGASSWGSRSMAAGPRPSPDRTGSTRAP